MKWQKKIAKKTEKRVESANGRGSLRRNHLVGVKASSGVLAISLLILFSLGILVTDATDPAAHGSPASIVWGLIGCVALVAWASLMWFSSQIWSTRPREKSLATLTCGLFAYAIPALAFSVYFFGTGIAIGPRPAPIELTLKLLALTGLASFIGGCLLAIRFLVGLPPSSKNPPK